MITLKIGKKEMSMNLVAWPEGAALLSPDDAATSRITSKRIIGFKGSGRSIGRGGIKGAEIARVHSANPVASARD